MQGQGLERLVKCCPNLQALDASHCLQPELTWQLEPLAELPQLTALTLRTSSSNMHATAQALAKLTQLSSLSLGCEFRDASLLALAALTQLTALQREEERDRQRPYEAPKTWKLVNQVGLSQASSSMLCPPAALNEVQDLMQRTHHG